MSSNEPRVQEDGFDYQGQFYPWHVSDMGKDLMLIDRFSGLPVTEFFELVDDDHERARAPILLSLIACSIRHGHPDWSVERIVRTVMQLELSAVTFVGGDIDEEPAPLPETAAGPSGSPSNGSSPSSTPEAGSLSETSSATPPSSTSPGSHTDSPVSLSPSSSRATGL